MKNTNCRIWIGWLGCYCALFCFAGCLEIIHEEQRDLSNFERFELKDDCDGDFRFIVDAAEMDQPARLTVRFEGELWQEKELADEEINQLRELSTAVILQTNLGVGIVMADTFCGRVVSWDRLDAGDGGQDYLLEDNYSNQLSDLMKRWAGI